jgi:hypothetical protein
MSHKNLKVFDIVEVVINPRQEEASFATVLELTDYRGEDAALIQYHNNSCGPQKVCVAFMNKHQQAD